VGASPTTNRENRLTSALIEARSKTHGKFENNARIAQFLRAYWRSHPTWEDMPEQQREALDQMAGKFSRIFSGQASYDDHWADLAGYSELARAACMLPPIVSLPAGFMDAAGNWNNRSDS